MTIVLPIPRQALSTCRRLAAEIAAEALDATSDLSTADRLSLGSIALALDQAAAARALVEPLVGPGGTVAETLTLIVAAAPPR